MTTAPGTEPPVRLRPARPGDLPACVGVWHAGLTEYGLRVGRPAMPLSSGPLLGLLGHLLATDPQGFLVAVADAADAGGAPMDADPAGAGGQVVGFVSALLREHVWFLAMLFVQPGYQERGLGRRLLSRVLAGSEDATHATCTDSAQPISNALYSRFGIMPRLPVLELVGRPRGAVAGLPGSIRAVPFELLRAGPSDGPGPLRLAASLERLDRATLGYAHPQDHDYLAAQGRLGYLYEAGDGRVVGYGYTSEVGRLGPIAVEDPGLMGPVTGHLLGSVRPAGAFSAWIPGSASGALAALLEAGLLLEDFPALVCWDRPFADFERYVPITLAVL
ncbi:MAG: GNAT family N-acetyltransferase [Candidatus Limnocylindrales bacterium]|nr:GNAT family N-acetyltransferase [Candidatus Limnocylindrales bacterium]